MFLQYIHFNETTNDAFASTYVLLRQT